MVPSLRKPKRFLQVANTSESFVIVAQKDCNLSTHDEVVSLCQQYAQESKALDDSDYRPQLETAGIEQTRG